MNQISPTNALNLFSKWERENKSIVVLFSTPSVAMSLRNGHFTFCLDNCLELSFVDDSGLRIFISKATFWDLEPGDIPKESLDLIPGFEKCVRIDFPAADTGCFVFVSTPPGSN